MFHKHQILRFKIEMNRNLNNGNNFNCINSFMSFSNVANLSQVIPQELTTGNNNSYLQYSSQQSTPRRDLIPQANTDNEWSPSIAISDTTNNTESTKLPSFNELLSSIPMPQKSNITSSGSSNFNTKTKNNNRLKKFNSFQCNCSYLENSSSILRPKSSHIPSSNSRCSNSTKISASNYSFMTAITPVHFSSQNYQRTNQSTRDLVLLWDTSGPIELVQNQLTNPRKYVCRICSRSFTTSGHLARHKKIHTGERKNLCPWPTCNARFARRDNCMQHYKTHTKGRLKDIEIQLQSRHMRME